MSDPPPPPLPADPVPAPVPAPLPAPTIPAGDDLALASASRARSLAGWTIGCTGLVALCCGGGALFGVVSLDRGLDEKEAELGRREAVEAERRETADLIDAVALRLQVDAAELPEVLPEAPPRDSWGNAIRYTRSRPGVATLASAGPDGRFDTSDDVTRTVRIE